MFIITHQIKQKHCQATSVLQYKYLRSLEYVASNGLVSREHIQILKSAIAQIEVNYIYLKVTRILIPTFTTNM